MTSTPTVAAVVSTPRLGHALREAVRDFYFNSWRLAPANLAWAAVLIGVLVAASTWTPALVLLVALGLPMAGIHRMAAEITRGEPATFGDFLAAMRTFARDALIATAAAIGLAIVLVSNVAIGLGMNDPIGWFLAASAIYALAALAMFQAALWPILVDPVRDTTSLRHRFALAGLVVVARPGRMLALTAVIGAVLVAGVVILAGIALVGVAYSALAAARYVLPVADRIEARQTRG